MRAEMRPRSHRIGPETARLMWRPRFGLVSRAPGGPGQPSAGIRTGRPMSGAARGGDEGAVATAPDRGPTDGICRRSEARLKGTENAAQQDSPSSAAAGAPLPSFWSEELDFREGLPGADIKNTGDESCVARSGQA